MSFGVAIHFVNGIQSVKEQSGLGHIQEGKTVCRIKIPNRLF